MGPTSPQAGRGRRCAATALFATTSAASLLLAVTAPAEAGPGRIVNGNQSSVINSAGNATNFLFIQTSSVMGAVTNAGTITPGAVVPGIFGTSAALAIVGSTIGGGIANSGTISANGAHGNGIVVKSDAITGGITSGGKISANGAYDNGIVVNGGGTVTGGITNGGIISANGARGNGIFVDAGSTVTGGIINGGVIGANGAGIYVGDSIVTGGITNGGMINAKGSGILVGGSTVTGGITNIGTITAIAGASANSIMITGSTVTGDIVNKGVILPGNPGGKAVGISVSVIVTSDGIFAGRISGGITNSGTISATGKTGIGIAVIGASTIAGGIINTGTISGSSAAIDLSQETGGATMVTQAAGALIGNLIGSSNARADLLNITGGRVVLAPMQSISGFGAVRQTGGTLVLQVTPTAAPSITAGALALGGTLQVAPQGNAAAFGFKTIFKDVFVANAPIQGSFASITTSVPLFQASVSPDALTPDALDVTLQKLSQTAVANSAQLLTQDLRFGLEAPAVLTETVQNRLGVGTAYDGGGIVTAALSDGHPQVAGGVGPDERGGVWARGFGVRGQADTIGTAPGYHEERVGIIAGADWHVAPGWVVGIAGSYGNTDASFVESSRTTVNAYQGLLYGGWSGEAWYVTGNAGGGVNDYHTTRQLAPEGLTGFATSSPTGESYNAYGEAGYRLVHAGYTITPYLGAGYVHAHVDAFSEAGGFGALAVAASNSNSFASTLGLRASTRIGDLVPELRLGWSHEFLDAAQTINGALVNVPGSAFSSTGANFGRDSAVVGAGVTHELNASVRLFVDYDGRLTGSFQEHAVSAGLRVNF